MNDYKANGNKLPEDYGEESLNFDWWIEENIRFMNEEIMKEKKEGFINRKQIQDASQECGYSVWDSYVWQYYSKLVYKLGGKIVKTEYKPGKFYNEDV